MSRALRTCIGGAAAFCTTVSYVSQRKKVWVSGEAGDLSLKMLLIVGSALALWIGYGIIRGISLSSRAAANGGTMKGALPGCAVLEPEYFARPAKVLARDLIGAVIVRQVAGAEQRLITTETEAYLGPNDLACHSAKGRTARTDLMFGPPGTLYIYLVYGLHLLLNIVAGPEGMGAAVLIRSAGEVQGPGRLGKALALSMELNGLPASTATGLWFEQGLKPRRILATPRIGVDYAGPKWSERKLRFIASSYEF